MAFSRGKIAAIEKITQLPVATPAQEKQQTKPRNAAKVIWPINYFDFSYR